MRRDETDSGVLGAANWGDQRVQDMDAVFRPLIADMIASVSVAQEVSE